MTEPFTPDDDEQTQEVPQVIEITEDDPDDGEETTDEITEEIERVGTAANGQMEGNLAQAIARRKETPGAEPAAMQIVNERAKGVGSRVSGPNLWQCLADYLDEEPRNLTDLAAALLRMYEDLKRRGMDDDRWAEIKGYLAMEILAVIRSC